jgi:alkylhydroperoxidase/carboxymuconolactone decarboxylase family protein YurZ
MSNSLAPSGWLFPSKTERQVSKALVQIDASALVAMRRDEVRLDRVAGTARRGMVRAAEVGALEATLTEAVPTAATYVHASAVAGAMGIAEVVYDAARGR